MDIEDLCKNKVPVIVYIGNDCRIQGVITKTGVIPGHMGRIGFAIKDDKGVVVLVNEPCTIRVNQD